MSDTLSQELYPDSTPAAPQAEAEEFPNVRILTLIDHKSFGLISEDEFAKAFGVEPMTAGKWRRAGEGPAFVPIGKGFFYRTEDVYAWIESRVQRVERNAS